MSPGGFEPPTYGLKEPAFFGLKPNKNKVDLHTLGTKNKGLFRVFRGLLLILGTYWGLSAF